MYQKPRETYDVDQVQRALAARGPFALLDQLGLRYQREHQAARLACPYHDERTPSATLRVGPEGTLRLHCFGSCSRSWDALSLVAQVHSLDVDRDFRDVLATCAGLAGVGPLPPGHQPPPRQPHPEPEPPRYAPPAEISRLMAWCEAVTHDPVCSAALAGRGINPGLVADLGLALALRLDVEPDAIPRWARVGGLPWPEAGFRLLVPTFAVLAGEVTLAGLRAWRVEGDASDGRKRVAPAGCSQAGLFLACPTARRMLERGSAAKLVVVEGEPDFLSLATLSALHGRDIGVLGVVAGSWTTGLAACVPVGSTVAVCTHDDGAGDRYAQTVEASAEGRFRVVRRPPEGRHADGRAFDLNDMARAGTLEAFDPFAFAPSASDPADPGACVEGEVDFAAGAVEWIRDFAAGRPQNQPIPTGFLDLDGLLHGGFREGDLWVFCGRTSQGKTSAMLSVVEGHLLAPTGRGAYVASVETKNNDAFARIFARLTRLHLARLRGAEAGTEDEVTRLVEAGAALAPLPFRLMQRRMTVEQIAGRVAAFHGQAKARGQRLGIVAVDYVQRVKKTNPRMDEREHVMHVCAELKELAMTENVAVVALSQVSRRVEERADKRPTLADLKESGSLEEDADGVVAVFRPGHYDPSQDSRLAELIVLKNRHGPIDRVHVRWRAETASYHDDE